MEQSENDYKNGKTQDLTDDILKEIFMGNENQDFRNFQSLIERNC